MLTRALAAGAAGISGLAAASYRIAPRFWERFASDLQRPVLPAAHHPRFNEWPSTGLHAVWIGHSTVLISMDGFTILTDPVFSTRAGLNIGPITLGIKRLVEPACKLEDLPRPDLILLSHAHMDHLDIPSLRQLENPGTTVITAVNTSDLLRVAKFGAVRELKWNERNQTGAADIRAFQVKHWGARMPNETHRGYNGYIVQCGRFRVLFGGDTAYTDSFRSLRSAGPIDLAIMPIGAYDPWISVHCNPEQALAMANLAGAESILPVHHRTFELSREPLGEPMERLLSAAGAAPDRIHGGEIGQTMHLS